MALQRRDLKQALPQQPHEGQLSLFGQQSVTFGDEKRSCDAVNRALLAPKPIAKATRFPPRPGCPLRCDCATCLNPGCAG